MKVAIVCESMFGNTDSLARQVQAGLVEAGAEVAQVDVGSAITSDFVDLDLLVLAAPTHALSLSRPESRAEAVALGADPARAVAGIREWLDDIEIYLPASRPRPVVAVLDTRILKSRHWPGSATHRAARGLRHAGFLVIDRVSFFVEGVTGPLAEGETVRARDWGSKLPELVAGCNLGSGLESA